MTRVNHDHVDVVVAGSGAAGLLAGLVTARRGIATLLLEAAPSLGGTTAIGGGRVWVPNNGSSANAGDSPALARTYLEQIFDPNFPEMIDALIETAPEMMRYIESNSRHKFDVCPNYPDYLPFLEGATTGGRCLDAKPLTLTEVRAEARNTLRANGYLPITHAEWEEWRYPDRFDWDLLHERIDNDVVTGGVALVAALADAFIAAGGTIQTSTNLIDVIFDSDGAVSGVVTQSATGTTTVKSRTVILATGGFDGSPDLVRKYLPRGLGVRACAPSNTGIALRIAKKNNIPVTNLDQSWWMPMISIPGETMLGEPYPRAVIRERGVGHQVIVNTDGRRFVDEATPYNEYGKAAHQETDAGSTPNSRAYVIYDDVFRQKYGLPGIPRESPFGEAVIVADSLPELADVAGINAANLVESIARFNRDCDLDTDTQFHKGENEYDWYYGDPRVPGNRCLGTVAHPPFYAVRIMSGSIGSKGGPLTTTEAQVLNHSSQPIPGLFCVGNAAAFWTKGGYPGPGATHTVGLTFAYRAGNAISRLHETPLTVKDLT